MSLNIAIINYGMGNLHSVYKRLTQLGVQPVVATTEKQVLEADKIVLPGVGHFAKAIGNLKSLHIYDALNEAVLVKKKPILGICLGMQLMAKESEEGEAAGFGWIDAKVVKFRIEDRLRHKVPQTGWNTATHKKDSALMKDIEDGSAFYFLHSFHYSHTGAADVLATTFFEYEYVSAIEKENIFGTQFHPEKSHQSGLQLFKNFVQI